MSVEKIEKIETRDFTIISKTGQNAPTEAKDGAQPTQLYTAQMLEAVRATAGETPEGVKIEAETNISRFNCAVTALFTNENNDRHAILIAKLNKKGTTVDILSAAGKVDEQDEVRTSHTDELFIKKIIESNAAEIELQYSNFANPKEVARAVVMGGKREFEEETGIRLFSEAFRNAKFLILSRETLKFGKENIQDGKLNNTLQFFADFGNLSMARASDMLQPGNEKGQPITAVIMPVAALLAGKQKGLSVGYQPFDDQTSHETAAKNSALNHELRYSLLVSVKKAEEMFAQPEIGSVRKL